MGRLVLIETGGTQAYIFGANRMRQNVGASQIVADAVAGPLAEHLGIEVDELQSGAFPTSPDALQVLTVTSGKAVLVAPDEDTAREVISAVTAAAQRDRPGLGVFGAHVAIDDSTGERDTSIPSVADAVIRAHREIAAVRAQLPDPTVRFAQVPPVARCATTGLPADEYARAPGPGDERELQSVVARVKLAGADAARTRMETELAGAGVELPPNLDAIGEGWIAVVHADGNGIGGVFQRLAEDPPRERDANEWYVDRYRRFSAALGEVTRAAFHEAITTTYAGSPSSDDERIQTLVLPLIVGGDDVTFVCDGRHALTLVERFLRAFEDRSADRDGPHGGVVAEIAGTVADAPGFSMSAGIAFVKSHHPFHAAYDLADALATSAKEVKRRVPVPTSSLDLAVSYDGATAPLDAVRARRTVDGVRLYGGPYVVDRDENDPAAVEGADADWVEAHRLSRLTQQMDRITEGVVPRRVLYRVREALASGSEATRNEVSISSVRYGDGLADVWAGQDGPLIETATGPLTTFVDALELIDVAGGDG